MCAKAILHDGFHIQSTETPTEPLVADVQIPNLGEFGELLAAFTGTQVSVLGEDHIRIPTPQVLDNSQIHSIRTFIANSLHLPVTIFREKTFIEIVAI